MIEKIDLGEIAKGCTKTIVFKQKMLLQGGDYLLSLGCTTFNAGSLSVYHRLYDVINLKVISLKNSIGYFDMYSEIMIV